MCLLIQQHPDTNFSDEFLKGVYRKNSDGIGVMWAEDNVLRTIKQVVSTEEEAVAFYREHTAGKECCVHWRMKTHGHIDLENCHPYPVFGFDGHDGSDVQYPLALMHNGVLSSGNARDVSKSDTWHFIRDVLHPLLKDHPEMVHNEIIQRLIAKEIGQGNKFALMDFTGKTIIINKHAGVEYEGAWLSNTYAWDYYGLHPNAPKQNFQGWQNGGYWEGGVYHPKKQKATTTTKRGGKTSSIHTQGDLLGNDEFDNAWEFLRAVREKNKEVCEKIYTPRIGQMFRKYGHHDMWDLLDWWENDMVTDADMRDALSGKKGVKEILANTELEYEKKLPVVVGTA